MEQRKKGGWRENLTRKYGFRWKNCKEEKRKPFLKKKNDGGVRKKGKKAGRQHTEPEQTGRNLRLPQRKSLTGIWLGENGEGLGFTKGKRGGKKTWKKKIKRTGRRKGKKRRESAKPD